MNLYEKLNRLEERYQDELTELLTWLQNYKNGFLWDSFAAEFSGDADPEVEDVLNWLEQFNNDAYYAYVDETDDLIEESLENYELSDIVRDSINHLINDLGKDPMADDFADDVCQDIENNYDIDVPQDMITYANWCYAVMSEVSRQVNKVEDELKENLKNPYFTPYGYRDAAKVLNRTAPEYYYHLKEIEMDRGDGVKLARYAIRKGLPVMVDKNSDPDYPEFAIKGKYHWNDYFYPYPTAHEEDLIAWDGKMFVKENITECANLDEAIDPTKAKKIREDSDAYVVFYGYQHKNDPPVEIYPEELSEEEFEFRKYQIINSFTKLHNNNSRANRYGKESDITFYCLYKR